MKKTRKRNPALNLTETEMLEIKFGKLKIIEKGEKDKNGRKRWKCLCDCGTVKLIPDINLKRGMTKSCGCSQYKKGKDHVQYTGYENISGKKWASIVAGAKERGLEFKITKKFIWELLEKQEFKCSISNVDISYKDNTASIDRIDNSKGYIESNVHIIHKDINIMRNKFKLDYFIKICKLITKNND